MFFEKPSYWKKVKEFLDKEPCVRHKTQNAAKHHEGEP